MAPSELFDEMNAEMRWRRIESQLNEFNEPTGDFPYEKPPTRDDPATIADRLRNALQRAWLALQRGGVR